MRRTTIVGIAALGLLALMGPALAETESGSHETHEECTTDPETNEETCVTVNDNDVKCGEGNVADEPTPVGTLTVSGNGDPTTQNGELEVCSEDSQDVLQGRIIVGGDASSGGYVIADGDQDNPEEGTGYARADVGPDGPTMTCSGPDSERDGTEPSEGDNQEQCGA